MIKTGRTFGELLHEARMTRQLTVYELAELVGVHSTAIRSWESGAKQPSIQNVQKCCRALRIWILINEDGEMSLARTMEYKKRKEKEDEKT